MAKLVLIDGHSILNRAFYGVPDLTNAQGVHTNAIYGFLNIMFKIIDEEKPEHLIVAFDMSAPTFRHKMFAEYKGTRKPMPEELRQQVPLIKEVLEAMGIEIVQKEGYEADDILGTIAKHSEKNGLDVSIVSGDRDILQIATEHIMIRIPKTKKGVTEIENYNACDIEALYGVTPAEFIDMKALMGDSSDNIPGAPGIGEKTAGAIIQKFGSVENAYNHIDEVTPNRARNSLADNYDQVLLSKKLATIDIDAPVEYDVDSATLDNMFSDKAYEMFKRYNFKSLLKKFDAATTTREPEIFDKFRTIEDFGEVEEYFAGADFGGCIGLKLLYEDGCVSGAALAHEDNSVCYIPVQGFVTEDYLKAKITDMAAVCDCIAGLNIKSVLPAIDRQVYPKLIDAGLGAYLLNPLKESYSYDELGNRISLTYPGGEIVRYSYDKCGDLLTVTEPDGSVNTYTYDKKGRCTGLKRADGTEESYSYDKADRLSAQTDKNADGSLLHSYTYTYDGAGNIIKIGGTADTAAGHAVMTYDKDNRLATYNGEKVTYDERGNMLHGPLNGEMGDYTYDCRNRLIETKAADGTVTAYTYDAENTRLTEETENTRHTFVTDKETTYSQLLTETISEKHLLTYKETATITYTYGNGLISDSRKEAKDIDTEKRYYHYNHIGSTTVITDADGDLLYSFTYGTYGELTGIYDADGQKMAGEAADQRSIRETLQAETLRFLYNGRYGVETGADGLYYMRARYYNPQIKRFINRDIIDGSITDSQSLNKYSYVQGNPVNLIDHLEPQP